jgi:S1-C subfamily serine protease
VSEHGTGAVPGPEAHPAGPAGTPPATGGTQPYGSPAQQPYAAPAAGQQFAWAPHQATAPQPAAQQPPTTPPHYPGYGGHPAPPPETGPSTIGSAGSPRRSGRVRIGIAGLVAGALIGGGAGAGVATLVDDGATSATPSASAQNVVIQNPSTATTATAAAAKAAPSVVTIYVASATTSGSGSGVVLTDDGYVVTNNHVVAEAGNNGTVQVRIADGTLYDAKIVGTDPASDLAVVKLDVSGLQPATFADSGKVQVGDVAVAIGAPLGLSNTVTDGIISATHRAVATGSTQNDATVIDALQTDAAINPGNSGGALVNAAGEVVGINSAIATVASGGIGSQSQSGNIGVGFAIPSNTVKRIADEIIDSGSATRAFLGVSAQTAADDQNSDVGTGAQIVKVESGSAASDAGLKEGDVITAVGDRPVTTSTELTAAVRSYAPGDKVTLTVQRDGKTDTTKVTLGSTS